MVAINEELTEKQKQYYIMFFVHSVPIPEIARMFGVNKSTVSRGITRARERITKIMRYSAPHLLNAPTPKGNKRFKK